MSRLHTRSGRRLVGRVRTLVRAHPLLAALSIVVLLLPAVAPPSLAALTASGVSEYVVSDLGATRAAVLAGVIDGAGGSVVSSLGVPSMASAELTAGQASALGADAGVVVTPDIAVSLGPSETSAVADGATGNSSTTTEPSAARRARAPAAVFPEQTGATELWARDDTGAGVNVAVLDTGIDSLPDFAGRLVGGVDLSGEGNPFLDRYGHGTFVAGLIAGDGASSEGRYRGEAPGAGLVSVKVAGASGTTDLATLVDGVAWTIAHAASLHIRVLNISLGFKPFQPSELNPLDQVVQLAWDAGIVVVASAGNAGPFNGTILSPGDDPQVITVGALDDLGQADPADDAMTSFSSVGPTTPDGWFKPDLVTSGRSVVSLRAPGSTIARENPQARVGSANFVGSGTSFSSAITAGAVALLLDAHPDLDPDQVKARLLASTTPGPVGNPFADGHGDLDVAAAVRTEVRFDGGVNGLGLPGGGLPLTAGASSNPVAMGSSVQLASTWQMSTWNPANWVGLKAASGNPSERIAAGSAWDGYAWNGYAWNNYSWDEAAWDGYTWDSASWAGMAWDGFVSNGNSWTSAVCSRCSWNADQWE